MNRVASGTLVWVLGLGLLAGPLAVAQAEEEGDRARPRREGRRDRGNDGQSFRDKVRERFAGKGGRARKAHVVAANGVALQGDQAEMFSLAVLKVGPRKARQAGGESEAATPAATGPRLFGMLNVAGNGYALRDIVIERGGDASSASGTTSTESRKEEGADRIRSITAVLVARPEKQEGDDPGTVRDRVQAVADAPAVGSLTARIVDKTPPHRGRADKQVPFLDGTASLEAGGSWRLLGRLHGGQHAKPPRKPRRGPKGDRDENAEPPEDDDDASEDEGADDDDAPPPASVEEGF